MSTLTGERALDNFGQLCLASCCCGQVPGHQVPAAVQGAGQVVGQAANSEGGLRAGWISKYLLCLFLRSMTLTHHKNAPPIVTRGQSLLPPADSQTYYVL